VATINDFGIAGLDQGMILHPKHKNRWRVEFVNLAQEPDSGRVLSLNASKTDLPHLSKQEVAIHRYNSTVYVAGKHEWSELNITIDDNVSNDAIRAIQAQEQLTQHIIGVEGPWLAAKPEASLYKFGMKIISLDGGTAELATWHIEGCWFKSINWGSLDYSDSGAVAIDLTVRYDHAYQTIATYSGGQGRATGGMAT
jgi:hypothetical protein